MCAKNLTDAMSTSTLDWSTIDNVVFDCDGVLWRGEQCIKGATRVIRALYALGKHVYFVTNNSSNSREQYRDKFRVRLGLDVDIANIYCSSFAAAAYLQDQGFTGKAYVIGHEGIGIELRQVGIETIEASNIHHEHITRDELDLQVIDESIGAVVVGLDSQFTYTKMAYSTLLLHGRSHVRFVCTNRDSTFPSSKRIFPGSGSCVAAVATGTQRQPVDVGKPNLFMLDHMKLHHQVDCSRTLMVGDRLDTDILFGLRGGLRTALVLSGVTRSRDEADAEDMSPEYIFDSVDQLVPH